MYIYTVYIYIIGASARIKVSVFKYIFLGHYAMPSFFNTFLIYYGKMSILMATYIRPPSRITGHKTHLQL